MDLKKIEDFFDGIAALWDGMQIATEEKILALLDKIGIKNGDRVLDVGCGTGVITGLLAGFSRQTVVGVDVSAKMIEQAKKKFGGDKNVTFIKADYAAFEWADLFDVIVVYNAYPHLISTETFCKTSRRLLRAGGRLAIIHSDARSKLNAHHERHAAGLSRPLGEPLAEYEVYREYFEICDFCDDDQCYYIIMKAKKAE